MREEVPSSNLSQAWPKIPKRGGLGGGGGWGDVVGVSVTSTKCSPGCKVMAKSLLKKSSRVSHSKLYSLRHVRGDRSH